MVSFCFLYKKCSNIIKLGLQVTIVFTVSPDVSISVYKITENGLKCQSVSPKAQNDSVKCLGFCAQRKDIQFTVIEE